MVKMIIYKKKRQNFRLETYDLDIIEKTLSLSNFRKQVYKGCSTKSFRI